MSCVKTIFLAGLPQPDEKKKGSLTSGFKKVQMKAVRQRASECLHSFPLDYKVIS